MVIPSVQMVINATNCANVNSISKFNNGDT